MSKITKSFPHLKSEHDLREKIIWLSLNRPEAKNALSEEMIESLVSALKAADVDPEVRVIVLGAEGNCFCAGGDIKAMEQKTGMFGGDSFELRDRYQRGIQKIPLAIESLVTPIIAMVDGAAIGAGCDLAAMCDLRVASSRAKFTQTFTQMGLVPGDGGAYFLTKIIGHAKTMEMYLTGNSYSGQQAFELGLINILAEPDYLYNKTLQLAQQIAAKSPIATEMTKKAVQYAKEMKLPTYLDLMASYQGIAQRTKDHEEAVLAFREKRIPHFKRS